MSTQKVWPLLALVVVVATVASACCVCRDRDAHVCIATVRQGDNTVTQEVSRWIEEDGELGEEDVLRQDAIGAACVMLCGRGYRDDMSEADWAKKYSRCHKRCERDGVIGMRCEATTRRDAPQWVYDALPEIAVPIH